MIKENSSYPIPLVIFGFYQKEKPGIFRLRSGFMGYLQFPDGNRVKSGKWRQSITKAREDAETMKDELKGRY